MPPPRAGLLAPRGGFPIEMARAALTLLGRGNLTLADLLARGELPRDLVPVAGRRFNVPEESFVAPAGIEVPPDVNVAISPQFSRGEGAAIGRTVVFGDRVYPGQLAHELVHTEQSRRYGPFEQPLYALIAAYLSARGQNPYIRHPFELEGERAREAFERRAEVAAAYQRQRRGERNP